MSYVSILFLCVGVVSFLSGDNRVFFPVLTNDEVAVLTLRVDQLNLQIALLKLAGKTRSAYFISLKEYGVFERKIDAVLNDIARLRVEISNREVAQAIEELCSFAGSIGAVAQPTGADTGPIIAQLKEAAHNDFNNQQSLVALSLPFYCVLKREVYSNLADALALLPPVYPLDKERE